MQPHLQQIVAYIQQHRQLGYSDEQISSHLKNHGWTPEWLTAAYTAAQQPYSTPAAATAKTKYKVFQSLIDAYKSARFNALPLTVVMAGSLFIIFVITFVMGLIVSLGVVLLETSATFVAMLIIYLCWQVLIVAFLSNASALAIAPGARRQKINIGEVLTHSIQRLPRALLACLLFISVLQGPFILLALVSIPLILASPVLGGVLAAVGIIMCASWFIIALLRYSLAPLIAIFEPQLPLKKVLGRSNHLLKQGGQWFLAKGLALVITLLLIISIVTGSSATELQNSSQFGIYAVLILLEVAIQGSLVMLYVNRVAIRGNQP